MYQSLRPLTMASMVMAALTVNLSLAGDSMENVHPNHKAKVLVVVTNHAKYPNRDDRTGLWLTELTHFYAKARTAGIELDLVSPKGGETPLDERSLGWLYLDATARGLLHDTEFLEKLSTTRAAANVDGASYAGIYFTGGHGTMWDFRENQELKRLAEGIYQQGGIVSAVCHGNVGLLNLNNSDGTPLIAGRRVTGFSNTEEQLSGIKDQVPFLLQDEMLQRGALYQKAWLPFISHVVVDGRIITGQNPGSSEAVADAVIRALQSRDFSTPVEP